MARRSALLMLLSIALASLALLAGCAGRGGSTTGDSPPVSSSNTQADTGSESSDSPSSTTSNAAAEQSASERVETIPPLSLPITNETPRAPRIRGEGVNEWINTEELTFKGLREENKVVLVDFWTYTCVNCIRTLPYLKQWHDKYADRGLVIIGIHTPEFDFEKSLANVQEAVDGFGIEYPVVQDNNYWTWNAFNNRYWPAKYLIDTDGYIRYSHFGEGKYAETEQAIRLLLEEAEQAVDDISDEQDRALTRRIDPNARSSRSPNGLTRELYAGTSRNYNALRSGFVDPYVLNEEFYEKALTDIEYTDPGDYQNHHIYLHGLWHNGEESLRHARTTEAYEDYMAIVFNAVDVNVVLRTRSDTPYTVQIEMDGQPLLPEDAGRDIWFDDQGRSFVTVDEPRLYSLVLLDKFESHELKLRSNSDEFEVFAFTFGAYVEHPDV